MVPFQPDAAKSIALYSNRHCVLLKALALILITYERCDADLDRQELSFLFKKYASKIFRDSVLDLMA